jgi:thiol-disulfide isomerase/thioredoxin
MSTKAVAAAAVLLAWAAGTAAAQELSVGDPAPRLAVKEFVKGEPVKDLEKGKVYVVEFWATWCGPCRASIPHLTELQKKHKDVTFIGVSVFEREPKGVKPFVAEMGDKMDYRVAMDDVAEGGKPNEGTMAKTWMEAAGQGGIPTAFIVENGKVAWIGHPMAMDRPLEQVVNGKWDLAAAAREFKERAAQERKFRDLQGKLASARQSGDAKELAAILDQGLTDFHENAQVLNLLAWTVVDPDAKIKPDAKLTKLALQAAKRADELAGGKDGSIADTLAKAYFDSGDAAKALETQERAVKLAEGTPAGNDPGLKARLEQYRKAVKKD